MSLAHPEWLLLLLPLGLVWWFYRGPTRPWQILRALLLIALVLAMAEPQLSSEKQGGLIVVVADRSASMPESAERDQLDAISTLRANMGSHDRLAVVSFGASPAIDAPPGRTPFTEFLTTPDPSGSSIGAALQRALAVIPADQPSRIFLLSDGAASDTTAREIASIAGGRSIPIDHRPLTRSAQNDLAIERIEAPVSVALNESFLISAWASAPVEQTAQYELRRAGTTIASGSVEVGPTPTRLVFRQAARSASTADYELVLRATADDPRPENNRARILVGVRDVRPILVVTETPGSGLSRLLSSSGLPVEASQPGSVDLSLAALASYDAVILENIAIQDIGLDAASTIARLVEESGLGLVMTGGERSFGAGGYYESPIEPVLPVSLELRSERRKLALAIVVAMDRSGSMSMPVAGGQTKMDLAGVAAASVAEMLTPFDEFGAIAIDTAPHTIVPLSKVEDPDALSSTVRRVQSMGGGIYVFTALRASVSMLDAASAGTRHIILFADAADAEEPGEFRNLLTAARAAGITVSVVGLGTDRDADAGFLEEVAAIGGGRSYFTTDARLLPQIFTQDTYSVARGAFLKEPVAPSLTGALDALLGVSFANPSSAGGYNPSYLRQGATLGAVTTDEFAAPFIAHWQAGLGRSAIYAGEVDGQYTGSIAQWNQYPELLTGLARSVLRRESESRSAVAIQRIEGSVARIELFTDPDRPLNTNPSVRVVREASRNSTIRSEAYAFRASGPDRLVAEIPLNASQVIAPAVDLGNGETIALAPMVLPYEAEHRPVSPAQGARLLRDISAASGGEARTELASIWEELPLVMRTSSFAPLLFALAAALLLIEVIERRTLLISQAISSRPALNVPVEHTRKPAGVKPVSAKGRKSTQPVTTREAPHRAAEKPDAPKTESKPKPTDDPAETLSAIRSIKRNRPN